MKDTNQSLQPILQPIPYAIAGLITSPFLALIFIFFAAFLIMSLPFTPLFLYLSRKKQLSE